MLVEFGLGTGDGGPWRRRLGDALPAPAELVRGELAWVITHGMAERVQLLVAHGVDLTSPFDDGTTPTAMAATTGHPELMEYLVAHGAPGLDLDRADAFIAAALADDRVAVGQLLTDLPALADEVRSARPALVTWAAACGQRGAVGLLVGLGFDVNAKGRTDVPSDQPLQTALHAAAERGTSSWPGRCCGWEPTLTCGTSGSIRPRWAGLATSARPPSSSCWSRSPLRRQTARRPDGPEGG